MVSPFELFFEIVTRAAFCRDDKKVDGGAVIALGQQLYPDDGQSPRSGGTYAWMNGPSELRFSFAYSFAPLRRLPLIVSRIFNSLLIRFPALVKGEVGTDFALPI